MTLPYLRRALVSGAVLCSARVIGAFGAVSVVPGARRGRSLPVQIPLLFNDFNIGEGRLMQNRAD